MIRARQLFKESYYFLFKHPLIIFYGILYGLPTCIALMGAILLFLTVGFTVSIPFVSVGFSFPLAATKMLVILCGSVAAMFAVALIFFGTIIIDLGFTAYIMQYLKKEKPSMVRALGQSWAICSHVVWVIPVYILYMVLFNGPWWFFLFVPFCYVHQLLLDGKTGFEECFKQSWEIFKKTGWTLIKLFILMLCMGPVLVLGILLTGIVGAVIGFSGPLAIALMCVSVLLICGVGIIPAFVVYKIAINKLYLTYNSQGEV